MAAATSRRVSAGSITASTKPTIGGHVRVEEALLVVRLELPAARSGVSRRWRISTAPLAPITAISADGHAR